MLGAMTAFASCQSEAALDGAVAGEEVSVTISVAMNGDSAATRTDGDGTTVDRCIIEIYTTDGDLYKRMVTPTTALAASFELRLITSQEYEFLLWADKAYLDAVNSEVLASTTDDSSAGAIFDYHYTTAAGLKAITADYSSYVGNDETRDAFYSYSKQTISAAGTIALDMKRPFAKLNVKSFVTDISDTNMHPKEVLIKYSTTIASKFDMSAASASGADISSEATLEWSAAAACVFDGSSDATPYYDLSTDYLFAAADAQDLIDFSMDITLGSGAVITNDNFKNIPIQRNYQTNVSGELLSKSTNITVAITPSFDASSNEGI